MRVSRPHSVPGIFVRFLLLIELLQQRALHVRQRRLRGAGLLLLLAESGLILSALAELADQRTEGRDVCRWCSALNCAPLASWWDCSLYEVSLGEAKTLDEVRAKSQN